MSDGLAELLASDPDFDAMSTAGLIETAMRPLMVTDRARALLVLSRRVDEEPAILAEFLSALEQDDANTRVVGLMTVRLFGLVGLLLNVQGPGREIAADVWRSLPGVDRDDVRQAMRANDVAFPW
jgi:hypothetical protein